MIINFYAWLFMINIGFNFHNIIAAVSIVGSLFVLFVLMHILIDWSSGFSSIDRENEMRRLKNKYLRDDL